MRQYHVTATARRSLTAVGFLVTPDPLTAVCFLVAADSLTVAVFPTLRSNSCSFLMAFLFMITVLFSAAS